MEMTARDRHVLLAAGMAVFVLMGAVQAVYGPALPVIARETGRGLASVSVLFTAHWIGAAVGVAAMFALGARMTPRVVVIVLAAGSALLGAGMGWGVMLAGAVLAGMGQGCAAVLFNPRLLAAYGPRGPAMLTLINAVFGAGAILAPLAFVALAGTFRPLFLVLAAGFVVTLVLARDIGRPLADTAHGRLRADWIILGFGAFGVGFEATLIGLGPAALVRSGMSEVGAAEMLSLFFVAFLAARILLVFVAHLVAPFTLFTLSVAGLALSLGGAMVISPGWMFVASGAFAATIFPGYFVAAVQRMGHDPRVSPLIVAGGLVGGIGMPFALAHMVESMGPRGLFLLLAMLSAMVVLAALAFGLRGRPVAGGRGPEPAP
jgi:fucose permease